jgi:hypothetical protein
VTPCRLVCVSTWCQIPCERDLRYQRK